MITLNKKYILEEVINNDLIQKTSLNKTSILLNDNMKNNFSNESSKLDNIIKTENKRKRLSSQRKISLKNKNNNNTRTQMKRLFKNNNNISEDYINNYDNIINDYNKLYWDINNSNKLTPKLLNNNKNLIIYLLCLYKPNIKCNLNKIIKYLFKSTILNIIPWIINNKLNLIKMDKLLLNIFNDINFINNNNYYNNDNLINNELLKDLTPTINNNFNLICKCNHCKLCSIKRNVSIINRLNIKPNDYRCENKPFTILQHFCEFIKLSDVNILN